MSVIFDEEDVYETIDDRTFKQKIDSAIFHAKRKVGNVCKWCMDNPYVSVPIILAGVGLVKSVSQQKHEKYLERQKNDRLNKRIEENERQRRYDEKRREIPLDSDNFDKTLYDYYESSKKL